MQNYKVIFEPNGQEITVPAGTTLKQAMEMAKMEYDFVCGGRGRCGKCRVRLLSGQAEMESDERKILEAHGLDQGIRLACKVKVNEDLTVALLQKEKGTHQILTTAVESTLEVDPNIKKIYLELPEPTLHDQRSDWQRLKDSLTERNKNYAFLEIPLSLLHRLPGIMRNSEFKVTAVLDDGPMLLGLEGGNTAEAMLGFAVDIGTTTIVGYLMDLKTGKQLETASTLNPQTKYGGDVISRIAYAGQGDGLKQLNDTVIEAINDLIHRACTGAGMPADSIYAVSIVGNTCMHHLFLGVDPSSIARAPYVPVLSEGTNYPAAQLGLKINPAGRVYVLPCIGGFVGADTVGVLLTTDIEQNDRLRLIIDIGTNGEIALGSKQRLVVCSTAAGPAFEGAQITHGMRGAAGAIDHVEIRDTVKVSVIGNEKARGICGSGLLDAIAELLDLGIINPQGRLLTPDQWEPSVAERFGHRLIEVNNMKMFVLVEAAEAAEGKDICITQKDIRELQLAKGAIATGIRILMEEYGVSEEDIDEVLLAGAFGNYLNPQSACRIGLIPRTLSDRIRPIGNAAGTGSKIALLSQRQLERASILAGRAEHIELSNHPSFTAIFARAISFPSDEGDND